MAFLRQRVIEHELLDEATPEEAAPNLADIVQLNAKFGGHRILRELLRKVAPADGVFTLLDVGAASGDTARVVTAQYPNARVVSLDRHAFNLGLAPRPKVLGDAFQLPFAAGSFDFVFSSLFLHHFTNEQVVELLRGFRRVARRAVLTSDLERHFVSYYFLPATRWLLGWNWITVHDGTVSVRAAFTASELALLAERAGLNPVEVRSHRPAFRLSLLAPKTHADAGGPEHDAKAGG